MNQDNQGLDFSTVIASTVHDLKNSLAALTHAHSQWLARLPEELRGGTEQGVVEHELSHLNGMLVQLLGLYKLGSTSCRSARTTTSWTTSSRLSWRPRKM